MTSRILVDLDLDDLCLKDCKDGSREKFRFGRASVLEYGTVPVPRLSFGYFVISTTPAVQAGYSGSERAARHA